MRWGREEGGWMNIRKLLTIDLVVGSAWVRVEIVEVR